MDKDSIWGGVTAAELLADAKMLEAMGVCACFDFRDYQGEVSYVCQNHPTLAEPEATQ